MPWLETIETRSLKICCDSLESVLHQAIKGLAGGSADCTVTVYRSASVNTDLFVQILHNVGEVDPQGSSLGLRIASLCASLGLVNHTIWTEDGRE